MKDKDIPTLINWVPCCRGGMNRSDRKDGDECVTGIRIKNPALPGGFVKSEIIEALDLMVVGPEGGKRESNSFRSSSELPEYAAPYPMTPRRGAG